MNDVYQNFFSKFLQKVDSIVPIRTRRVLNPIQNRDNTIKNSSNQAKKLIRIISKIQDFYFKKLWITKRNLLEEKIDENKSNLKELWITLRSLGTPSKVEGNLNIIIRELCSLLWFNKELKWCFWFVFTLTRLITTKTSISKTQIWNQNQGRILKAAKVLLPKLLQEIKFLPDFSKMVLQQQLLI